MAKTRIVKGGQASAATPNPEKLISAKKILGLESKNVSTGSPGANRDDSSLVVSKREKIAWLAYSYWLERGCQDGSPEEDWFRAEREIDSAMSSPVAEN